MCKIAVFAGTSEGRRLLERLTGRGLSITVCVATEYGETLLEEAENLTVSAARLDGEAMAALLRDAWDSTEP